MSGAVRLSTMAPEALWLLKRMAIPTPTGGRRISDRGALSDGGFEFAGRLSSIAFITVLMTAPQFRAKATHTVLRGSF
jgi:hypothetical protein